MADSANKILVLIAGNAGHGKDTLGEFLQDIFEPWTSVRHDYFAYTLKLFAHQALGTPWHLLNGDKQVKESTTFEVCGEDTGVTLRSGLQDIGHFFRERFDRRVWANSVRLRAKNSPERVTVVTDCRHPEEEIHWMRETCCEFANVYIIRIRNSAVPVIRGHPSEDQIADAEDSEFDFIIENDGTVEDLHEAALQVASAIVLLNKTSKKRLAKKARGWLVCDVEGRPKYEPLLSEDDALTLVHAGEGYHLREVSFDRLKGQRVDGR